MKKKSKSIVTQINPAEELPGKSRRDFMKTAWKGLGIIAGIEFSGLTLHYLVDRKGNSQNDKFFEAGLPGEFPKNSVTPFRMGRFYLVRLNNGGFIALSLKCSHLGCAIIWDEKSDEFVCPCHSSKFNVTGDVINPPAPRALDVYEIEINEGKIFVNLSKKSKREKFENSQLTYI